MRKKRKLSKLKPNSFDDNLINLTPLIDVVFVVLVTFILIAPLLEADHVNLSTSSINSDQSISQTPIVLKVKEDNSILLNKRLVTLQELTKLLKESKRQNPSSVPQLYHDKNAAFGTYQSIKNALEAAGYEQVDVVLKPN
ncbi:MAG: biopolymer transporter ExbD [Parachlamydiales bacterium]|nr:biopolymer transporter ExbD [Parachlamydiales bacterium]